MKKALMVLKKILFRIVFFYFLLCILYTVVIWTSNVGSISYNTSNHPDAWVILEPAEIDWVKNNPSKDWELEKWEAPNWTKRK